MGDAIKFKMIDRLVGKLELARDRQDCMLDVRQPALYHQPAVFAGKLQFSLNLRILPGMRHPETSADR
ncbi:hypothetical protein [Methylocella silvestris]|uniref:hypothetical protein n=1 Tax=Methylocella silvestris TaxID=199596 RepID=UPI001FE16838|nr:hypothetical protein [Methylocella silvestris]